MPHIQLGYRLIAGLILALIGVGGVVGTMIMEAPTDMRIELEAGVAALDGTFTISVVVESHEPVNVFKGDLRFDPTLLRVESIDYNTSIADLWAEEPWYSNGEGTLNFIGGTTRRGGFIGTGSLLTITFKTLKIGSAVIALNEARILRHDGLGTDAELMPSIDAVFTVREEKLRTETLLEKQGIGPKIDVVPELPPTDLNGDGEQSFADVGIFMRYMLTQDIRGDLNGDGSVTSADLTILRNAK